MNKEEKALVIEEISQKISDHNYIYIADANGLSVAQVQKLRQKCFDAGIEYKVYKNTLIQKALEASDLDYTELYEALKGMSGVFFSKENGSGPAKILKDFKKTVSETTTFKGASIDSDIVLGEENLEMLSKLKSKDELLGEIIGLLQSPAKNVISALSSGGNKLAGIIKTLSEKEA